MEKFGARSTAPIATCIDEVKRCKIFIGIIGMRYGSVHEDGRSFVQIEYESAISEKKDILIYVVDEDKALFPPKHVDLDDNAKKLKSFKNHLKKTHTVEFFVNPNDLANKIKRDLSRHLKDTFSNDKKIDSLSIKSEKVLPLIRTLHGDYDDRKRIEASQQLRGYNDEQVIEALLQSVKYDKRVRYEALTSLYMLKCEKALSTFTERIFDPSPRIRNISIIALGEIGGESNLEDLRMIIDTQDFKNRNQKRSGGKGQRVNWGRSENIRAAETAIGTIEKRLGIQKIINDNDARLIEIESPPKTDDFRIKLQFLLSQAQSQNKNYVDINAAQLHGLVGGYSRSNHRIPICCNVMYQMMQSRDKVLHSPLKGKGSSLVVRYYLPRNNRE